MSVINFILTIYEKREAFRVHLDEGVSGEDIQGLVEGYIEKRKKVKRVIKESKNG